MNSGHCVLVEDSFTTRPSQFFSSMWREFTKSVKPDTAFCFCHVHKTYMYANITSKQGKLPQTDHWFYCRTKMTITSLFLHILRKQQYLYVDLLCMKLSICRLCPYAVSMILCHEYQCSTWFWLHNYFNKMNLSRIYLNILKQLYIKGSLTHLQKRKKDFFFYSSCKLEITGHDDKLCTHENWIQSNDAKFDWPKKNINNLLKALRQCL